MAVLNVRVSEAMAVAVRDFAKAKSQPHARVTISDVVVGVLRAAGFERDDVLEAIERGEIPPIDIRVRTAAPKRDLVMRVRDYLAAGDCRTVLDIARNLHVSMAETKRAVETLLELDPPEVAVKPFDRPTFVHWKATCRCKTALEATKV